MRPQGLGDWVAAAILFLFLTAIVLVAALFLFLWFVGEEPDRVEIPSLLGAQREEAVRRLEEADLAHEERGRGKRVCAYVVDDLTEFDGYEDDSTDVANENSKITLDFRDRKCRAAAAERREDRRIERRIEQSERRDRRQSRSEADGLNAEQTRQLCGESGVYQSGGFEENPYKEQDVEGNLGIDCPEPAYP